MRHVPVLLNEVMEGLNLAGGAKVIDCTVGDGGHSEAMLERIGPKGKLLGIDADPESLLRAKQYLYNFSEQATFVRDNFSNLATIIRDSGFGPADAIVMDLGWSSPQFEERGRGFSFQKDEPLDMRFTGKSQIQNLKSQINSNYQIPKYETASEWVNNAEENELATIFKKYAEEKFYNEIANAIVTARASQPIETTGQLVEIILRVYRRMLRTDKDIPWMGKIHPATKVFQALRIAVNDELGVLKAVLPQALDALKPGGRLAVISFHSLEDRVVKQYFQKEENKTVKIINKKPIEAGEEELKINPRARSAKLRVVEKI